MRPIHSISVSTRFPAPFQRLQELLGNLYWTWDAETRDLLESIDPILWERVNHSPLHLLSLLSDDQIASLAEDDRFMEGYNEALARFDEYMAATGWYDTRFPGDEQREESELIAYFSAEFGIHESVPLYSGGLGVLSGDHTKAASDLNLPFVGVGLLYQMGYFRQRITLEGTQLESYAANDPSFLPMERLCDREGRQIVVTIDTPGGAIHVGAWQMNVGRVPLYLLDTNLPQNDKALFRNITGYLYGGEKEMRILQELVLGIGGMKMLERLGIEPTVTHCNEGHSAFLLLERTRRLMTDMELSFEEAARLSASGSIFTTHTPVPAGHDVFDRELVERHLGSVISQLQMTPERFMELGRVYPEDTSEGFSMTVLALKLSSGRNGVSQLHGEVSRDMWKEVWPHSTKNEVPITGITNGVHTGTFVSPRMATLYDQYIGDDWREHIAEEGVWDSAEKIPSGAISAASTELRSEMVTYIRRRLLERRSEAFSRGGVGRNIEEILDPNVLTIGFARRFATYKRATLILRDRDRALRLFRDEERPIQLLVAGKAHPKDEAGKEYIRQITAFIQEEGLQHRILFLEDYDIGLARAMVQGCDVWLNTPRRPMEASGTSGMKAAMNGTINLSVLDGWFPEAYDGTNGWAIGDERTFIDEEYQDEIESRHLYRILEEEVIPSFYADDSSWADRQKRTIATMAGKFSSHRMVEDYTRKLYRPAMARYTHLAANSGEGARNMTSWLNHLEEIWGDVRIEEVSINPPHTEMQFGDEVEVDVRINSGRVAPANIQVEVLRGPLSPEGEILEGDFVPLKCHGEDGSVSFHSGTFSMERAGQVALAVRAIPNKTDLVTTPDIGLVTWK